MKKSDKLILKSSEEKIKIEKKSKQIIEKSGQSTELGVWMLSTLRDSCIVFLI